MSLLTPGAPEAEPYRLLRHRVEQLRGDTGAAVVAVTSPGVGEGKTTTAINLAGALAQDARARVLLVDADLRNPDVASRLGLARREGLVEVVLGHHRLTDVVEHRAGFNLSLLAAGAATPSPYEVLGAPAFADLLAETRRNYDYVVLDTPPMLPFPDGRMIADRADAVLVVVAAHRTLRSMLADTLDALAPSKVAGLVFNGDDRRLDAYTAYAVPSTRARDRIPDPAVEQRESAAAPPGTAPGA